MATFPTLELNGRAVDEYEIDCFGLDQEDINPDNLLFTYAEFIDTGKHLTDNQLYKLSKKYPDIIYRLAHDLMSEDSPYHQLYGHLVDNTIES